MRRTTNTVTVTRESGSFDFLRCTPIVFYNLICTSLFRTFTQPHFLFYLFLIRNWFPVPYSGNCSCPFQEFLKTMQNNWDIAASPWAVIGTPEPAPKRPRDDAPAAVPSTGLDRLNLTNGIPSEAMPLERQRKWGHARVTEATMQQTHALMLKGRPSASATLSLMRAYTRWRRANGYDLETPGRSLAIFGGYLVEATLKYTTCASYVRTVLSIVQKESQGRTGCEWHVVGDVLKGIDLFAAAEVPDHALDIDEERAQWIIDRIESADVQFTVWAMCTIGGRVSDLNNFGGGQMFLRRTTSPPMFSVDFRVTKVGRTQCEKYSVTLPVWLPWKERWNEFLTSSRPFPADTDRFNKILHKAGFAETSYSFRRLFINRIIDRFTEKGMTEWCQVIELTGHQQVRMAKGTYKIPDAQRQLTKVGPRKPEKAWVFD